jgi:hypothetical protein
VRRRARLIDPGYKGLVDRSALVARQLPEKQMRMQKRSPEADRPAVSIVIPCFNAERWIAETISSALSQSVPPAEIVIVDDGSTDGTARIATSFAQTHPDLLRVISQSNKGAPAARSAGLESTSSPYISFVDADDRLLPEALAIFCQAFRKGADIAYGRAYWIDDNGRRLGPREQDPDPSGDAFVSLFEQHPTTTSVAFSRAAISACHWDISLPCAQEFDVLVRCAIRGFRFAFEPEYVAEIRDHPSPHRITNSASAIFSKVACQNILNYRKTLIESGTMTPIRSSALHFALLSHSITLARQGHAALAREVFRNVDRLSVLRARKFRLMSDEFTALIGGPVLSDKVSKLKQAVSPSKG